MRITFKKIEIHNFKSFSDEIFEFDKNIGLNLVCGKNNDLPGSRNGSGKSALFSALVFSLFGQTQENIKNCNVSNKYIKSKEVRVVTYFEIENHQYKIASGFNKYGGPYCQLCEQVKEDEIDLTKSTISETRKYLAEEILHCDISIFLRTVLLSSDQNYNFFRLKKWEKKEFIEKLFDISVFGDMYNLIHRDVLDFDKNLILKQDRLLQLTKNDEDYKNRIQKHEAAQNSKKQELNNILTKLKDQQQQLRSVHLKENSTEVKKYTDALDKLNSKVQEIITTTTATEKLIQKQLLQKHKIESSIDQKQKVINKHSELLNKLCDDCKQIFKDYYSIQTYIEDVEKLTAQKNTIETTLNESNSKKAIDDQTIADYKNKISKIENKISKLTAEANTTSNKLAILSTKIASAEKQIADIDNTENPYTELYQSNLLALDSEKSDIEKLTDSYKYLKFAETIVSQDTLRKFIIADLIGLLNNKIKSYLIKFGAKYDVVFDSDMNYVFTTEGGTCEYDNFSSGERARLMIAACFAFRDFMYIRNNFSSNILILDEFIDGAIDSLAIESILEILKDFSKLWNQNIYVISHRKEVNNDIFNNIIQVVKTNNISKITYIE